MGADTSCFPGCLRETSSIYRLGISRLGVCHVVDGLVSVLIGAGLMWLNQGTIWSGIGVWTGLPIMITGVVCLFSRQKKSRGRISGVTLMCIVSMTCAGFIFSTAAYNFDRVVTSENITDNFPGYHLQDESPLLVCNLLLMMFGLIEFVISIWSAAISVGLVCMCCNMGRDLVFTIPYEGMDNEAIHGPDIVGPRAAVPGPGPAVAAFLEDLGDLEDLADDSGLPRYSARGGPGARHRGEAASVPPVLHIDMDMEWDEMAMPDLELDTADFVNPQTASHISHIAGGR